jgi:hypothetical protein
MTVKNFAIRYLPRGEEAFAAHWLVGFDEEKAPQWNTLLDFKNQGRIEKDFFRLNENSLFQLFRVMGLQDYAPGS